MAKKTVVKVTKIPLFYEGKSDVLLKLKSTEFPQTAAGQNAYCDYMILKWSKKKSGVAEKFDPKAKEKGKLQRRLERMKAKQEELEAELEEMGDGSEE